MSFYQLSESIKKEIRVLSDFLINSYLVPWDSQLTAFEKELKRIFYLENDYLLFSRTEHGILENSQYAQRIIQKTVEAFLRKLEEICPDLEKFLAFIGRHLRIIDE